MLPTWSGESDTCSSISDAHASLQSATDMPPYNMEWTDCRVHPTCVNDGESANATEWKLSIAKADRRSPLCCRDTVPPQRHFLHIFLVCTARVPCRASWLCCAAMLIVVLHWST